MQIETSQDDLLYLTAEIGWDPDYERAFVEVITIHGKQHRPDIVLKWSSQGNDEVLFRFLRDRIEEDYEDVLGAYERTRNDDLRADIYAAKVKERLT